MKADSLILYLAFFKILDMMETATFFPEHEANPLVLQMGLQFWVLVSLASLVLFYLSLKVLSRVRIAHLAVWAVLMGGMFATVGVVVNNLFWMLLWLR